MNARLAAPLAALLLSLPCVTRADENGLPPPSVDIETGFDPVKDGLPFVNTGSVLSPGGDCFGMSFVSIERFDSRKAGTTFPNDPFDVNERALAGIVEARYMADYPKSLSPHMGERLEAPSSPKSGNAILGSLKAGTPAIVHLQSKDAAHVVVFYGYKNGAFEIYDPNTPGQVQTWSFDPDKGFGSPPAAYSSVQTLAPYDPKDLAKLPGLTDVSSLRAACDSLGAACSAPYYQVTTQLVPIVDGSHGTAYVVSGIVTGSVAPDPDGSAPVTPAQAVVFVNGTSVGAVNLDANGHFEDTVYAGEFTQGQNDVRVAVITKNVQIAGFSDTQAGPPVPAMDGAAAPPSATTGLTGSLSRAHH
jgi:hypothetical protein